MWIWKLLISIDYQWDRVDKFKLVSFKRNQDLLLSTLEIFSYVKNNIWRHFIFERSTKNKGLIYVCLYSVEEEISLAPAIWL